jgi:hypothetical protein
VHHHSSCWLRWGLPNFLLKLTSNCDPPGLCLPPSTGDPWGWMSPRSPWGHRSWLPRSRVVNGKVSDCPKRWRSGHTGGFRLVFMSGVRLIATWRTGSPPSNSSLDVCVSILFLFEDRVRFHRANRPHGGVHPLCTRESRGVQDIRASVLQTRQA